MKPYYLLIIILFTRLATAAAQQRTRDILFPSFEQDIANLRQKEIKSAPAKEAGSTREQIFTNYQRPGNSQIRTRALQPTKTGRAPSDVSAAEAEKAAGPRTGEIKPATPIPSQGNANEKALSPAITLRNLPIPQQHRLNGRPE